MNLEVTIVELELLQIALKKYRAKDNELQAAEDLLDWTLATVSEAKGAILGSPMPAPVPLKKSELEVAVAALERYLLTSTKLTTKAAARRAEAKDRVTQVLANVVLKGMQERHRVLNALLERARTLACM